MSEEAALYPSLPGYTEAMRAQSQAMVKQLMDIINGFENVTTDILLNALDPTAELSDYYCPKDTHKLVESRYLVATSFRGKPRVELGYARGGNPFYAAIVHERLDMRHAEPTCAKFLQRALQEDLGNIQDRIASGYRGAMASVAKKSGRGKK